MAGTGGSAGTAGSGGSAGAGGSAGTGGGTGVQGPATIITFGSVADGESTTTTQVSFDFASNPAGATGFECRLGSTGAFDDCTAGFTAEGLLAGGYTLEVRAIDAEGNQGAITTRNWLVTALATTIVELQQGTVPEHTLARVSTNVKLSGMILLNAEQLVFVQEAQQTNDFSVDQASDLNNAAYSGILTRPAAPQSAQSLGTAVTVTGIYRRVDSNAELLQASYQWGGAGTPWNPTTVRTSSVLDARLHGVSIRIGGEVPTVNCSSSCFNTTWFGHGGTCIRPCFSTCNTLGMVEWVTADGVSQPAADWGAFEGFLVGMSSGSYLLITASEAYGDDVCM
jgi:hypothetical protein